MSIRMLTPAEAERAMKLAKSSYRPAEVTRLQKEIEGETRAVNLCASINGFIDQDRIEKIVAMRLQLDALYGAWIDGKIS